MAVDQVPQKLGASATNPTFVAADGTSHLVKNNGKVWLHVRNANVAIARTITINPVQTVRAGNSQFPDHNVASLVFSVPSSEERLLGPFPTCYNDTSGKIALSFSAAADVTVAAFEMDPL